MPFSSGMMSRCFIDLLRIPPDSHTHIHADATDSALYHHLLRSRINYQSFKLVSKSLSLIQPNSFIFIHLLLTLFRCPRKASLLLLVTSLFFLSVQCFSLFSSLVICRKCVLFIVVSFTQNVDCLSMLIKQIKLRIIFSLLLVEWCNFD